MPKPRSNVERVVAILRFDEHIRVEEVQSNDQNLWMRPRENGTLEAYPPGQNPTEEVI
jgi:hypothetical protein